MIEVTVIVSVMGSKETAPVFRAKPSFQGHSLFLTIIEGMLGVWTFMFWNVGRLHDL